MKKHEIIFVLIILFGFCFLPTIAFTAEYAITDLGLSSSLKQGNFWVRSMNNNSEIVCMQFLENNHPTAYVPILIKQGEIINLFSSNPVLTGYYGMPLEINDCGQILGEYYHEGSGDRGYFLWQNGAISLMPKFVYDYEKGRTTEYVLRDINNAGIIIGEKYAEQEGVYSNAALYLKDNKENIIIESQSEARFYAAIKINNNGQVILSPSIKGDPYKNSSLYNIETESWESEELGFHAVNINDKGQIVGQRPDQSGSRFLWEDGKLIDMDPSSIGLYAAGFSGGSINDNTQVVGNKGVLIGDGYVHQAFIWENNELKNLNDLVPANSGWTLLSAYEINNSGQIVGYGYLNGQGHSCLLNVVPEPSTIFMLLSGIFGCFWFRKKQ